MIEQSDAVYSQGQGQHSGSDNRIKQLILPVPEFDVNSFVHYLSSNPSLPNLDDWDLSFLDLEKNNCPNQMVKNFDSGATDCFTGCIEPVLLEELDALMESIGTFQSSESPSSSSKLVCHDSSEHQKMPFKSYHEPDLLSYENFSQNDKETNDNNHYSKSGASSIQPLGVVRLEKMDPYRFRNESKETNCTKQGRHEKPYLLPKKILVEKFMALLNYKCEGGYEATIEEHGAQNSNALNAEKGFNLSRPIAALLGLSKTEDRDMLERQILENKECFQINLDFDQSRKSPLPTTYSPLNMLKNHRFNTTGKESIPSVQQKTRGVELNSSDSSQDCIIIKVVQKQNNISFESQSKEILQDCSLQFSDTQNYCYNFEHSNNLSSFERANKFPCRQFFPKVHVLSSKSNFKTLAGNFSRNG